jgi:hypothetical protein
MMNAEGWAVSLREGLYARVSLLPPPDDGLFAVPRVHMLEPMRSQGDGDEEEGTFDPAAQCSVWQEHWDPVSGRAYYNHVHTGASAASIAVP